MSTTDVMLQLCDVGDVDPEYPLRVEIDGFAYAVYRVGDDFHVTADLCSHGPGRLSDGFVMGCEVECPFHQGRFDIRTGQPTYAPCSEPIRAWTPVIVDGMVCINA